MLCIYTIGRLYEDIFLYIVATLELVRLDQLPPPKCFSKLDPSFGGFVAFHQTAIFLKDVLSWSSFDEVSGIKATALSMSDSRHFIRTLNPGVATGSTERCRNRSAPDVHPNDADPGVLSVFAGAASACAFLGRSCRDRWLVASLCVRRTVFAYNITDM